MQPTETVVREEQSFSETAYEWFQRCRQKEIEGQNPTDPSSAARAFFRPMTGGTGIAFLDAALRRGGTNQMQMPVIDIRGDVGKTWTILSLAARYVVATRPSKFQNVDCHGLSLPQVVILDSGMDVTLPKLSYVVRSTLLRQMPSSFDQWEFQKDMESCLGRIHIATVSEISEWIALLESLKAQLSSFTEHPTLLLWDSFLSEPSTETGRSEVIRLLNWFLEDCTVVAVTTSSSSRLFAWEKFVTHRIRLEQDANGYVATVHGSRVPFSISLAGVLS